MSLPYGENEGDIWSGLDSEVQDLLGVSDPGTILIHEMARRGDEVQELIFVTTDPGLVARAKEGDKILGTVLCPRCERERFAPYGSTTEATYAFSLPALSRTDNQTYICTPCGRTSDARFTSEPPIPPASGRSGCARPGSSGSEGAGREPAALARSAVMLVAMGVHRSEVTHRRPARRSPQRATPGVDLNGSPGVVSQSHRSRATSSPATGPVVKSRRAMTSLSAPGLRPGIPPLEGLVAPVPSGLVGPMRTTHKRVRTARARERGGTGLAGIRRPPAGSRSLPDQKQGGYDVTEEEAEASKEAAQAFLATPEGQVWLAEKIAARNETAQPLLSCAPKT